jgi:hypothetical protein
MSTPTTNPNTASFAFNPLLDVGFLHSIYEGDYTYAKEVFGNFLNEIRKEIYEMETAWQQADIKKFRSTLHKIKPTFSLVGLSFISGETEALIIKCDEAEAITSLINPYNELKLSVNKWLPVVEEEYVKLQNYNS